ncbi:MAG: S9 family peptidase [Balneolales bacterium]
MKSIFTVTILLLSSIQLFAQQNQLTFDHLFDGTFTPQTVSSVNWMQDGEFYTSLARNEKEGTTELRKNSILDDSYTVMLSSDELIPEGWTNPIQIQNYSLSENEKQVLIETSIDYLFRRSTQSHFYVFNLETRNLSKLTEGSAKQSYASFSPNGRHIAFFRENNLFYVDLNTGSEKQITFDGEINQIINGAADWVYEEEFYMTQAFSWSPDGRRVAFHRFDERDVKEFVVQQWNGDYPEELRFKYPKAGYRNSIVTIGVYDIETGETVWIDTGEETDQYIPRINWTRDPDVLSIRRLNRLQNRQDLLLADVNNGKSRTIKTETSDSWISVNDDLTFLENGEQFIYVSEEDGYNHIYLYDMDGNLIRQVTSGPWEVASFHGYNEYTDTFYYTSTEKSPLERHFYLIHSEGTGKERISTVNGWHTINMAPDFSYYLDYVTSDEHPQIVTLFSGLGEKIQVLEDNAGLEEKISTFDFPNKEYTTITVADSVELNGFWLKPSDFDDTRQYPVLLYVYGGPRSQVVQNWYESSDRALWHRYLVNQGYLIFTVDNRGTGGRGKVFSEQVYRRLGELETADQIEAARQLATLPYVDSDRIGIWGWSYGGYLSSLALAYGADVFSMAIAVAPVTNWRFYDTIYTERYMQTPQLNPNGYSSYAPVNVAGNIKGNYLLIHGTGDDNVHFQHSIEMTNELIEAGVQFETMFYPNRAHSISGGNSRRHLFELMLDFIQRNL